MLRSLLRQGFARFGRRYRYDTSYLEELAEAYPGKAVRFALLGTHASHHGYVPTDAFYAAKLRSARLADCGPCVGLVTAMGLEAGVPESILRAILEGRPEDLPEACALAYRYAGAMLGSEAVLPELCREIELRFGRRGLWDLACAVAWGQFYPVLKRGLGRAESCSLIDPANLMEGLARAG